MLCRKLDCAGSTSTYSVTRSSEGERVLLRPGIAGLGGSTNVVKMFEARLIGFAP